MQVPGGPRFGNHMSDWLINYHLHLYDSQNYPRPEIPTQSELEKLAHDSGQYWSRESENFLIFLQDGENCIDDRLIAQLASVMLLPSTDPGPLPAECCTWIVGVFVMFSATLQEFSLLLQLRMQALGLTEPHELVKATSDSMELSSRLLLLGLGVINHCDTPDRLLREFPLLAHILLASLASPVPQLRARSLELIGRLCVQSQDISIQLAPLIAMAIAADEDIVAEAAIRSAYLIGHRFLNGPEPDVPSHDEQVIRAVLSLACSRAASLSLPLPPDTPGLLGVAVVTAITKAVHGTLQLSELYQAPAVAAHCVTLLVMRAAGADNLIDLGGEALISLQPYKAKRIARSMAADPELHLDFTAIAVTASRNLSADNIVCSTAEIEQMLTGCDAQILLSLRFLFQYMSDQVDPSSISQDISQYIPDLRTFRRQLYKDTAKKQRHNNEKVAHEVLRAENAETNQLRRLPFARLCRAVARRYTDGEFELRWQDKALDALQTAVEAYVVCMMRRSRRLAQHARRVTVTPKDVELLYNLLNDDN